MDQNNLPSASASAKLLYDALKSRNVEAILEHNDGHKTVDIAVLDAKLFIEVDGLQHFTNPEQILRDFKRSHYSDGDDFRTFYVTNQIIEKYVNEVADALAKVILDLKQK
jgi:very-short-patch-repair endonuclease